MKSLRDLTAAFTYFSVFPARSSDTAPDDDVVAFLPIVGIIVGALAGSGAYGIALITHSQIAAAITAWILSLALSGAIHVDGFLDCCDGLFAMAPPERRLEIMRDPHHGTYAIVGMAMISVLWLYALALIPPALLPLLLAATGFVARAVAASFRTRQASVIGIVPLMLMLGFLTPHFATLGIFVIGVLVSNLVTIFARSRLGGVLSGDCYGAAIVVSEVAMLLAYPALLLLR